MIRNRVKPVRQKRRRAAMGGLLATATLAALAGAAPREAHALAAAVRINGVSTPVYFNDGDTFRALAGRYRGRAARLAGFNTLESYGPAHKWGGWTYKELYANAKQATLNARRGVWNCELDPSEKDGYGRVLAICKDLGLDHIRRGYAHAYTIGDPSPMYYIRAQRDAIVHRRGMWAKGVPAAVLTSLHSADERFNNSRNYNRLISPLDGVSSKWKHQNKYGECEEVCHKNKVIGVEDAKRVIAYLRADDKTEPLIRGLEDPYLMVMLNEYLTMDRVARIFGPKSNGHEEVKRVLDAVKKAGQFGTVREIDGACMQYATFERRYIVKPKPKCLKW